MNFVVRVALYSTTAVIFPLPFSNLDDIKLSRLFTDVPNKPALDAKLVPFSAPKLRGRLALRVFEFPETWTPLMASCGLRFRYIELCWSTSSAPAPLEACAETLETLRPHAMERSQSKRLCTDFPTGSS